MKHPMLQYTRHAAMRLAQRGFRSGDPNLILRFATEVEGGYLVRERDVLGAGAELDKRSADRFKRLVGKRVVVDHGCVVTAYHTSIGKRRRLLRDRRQRLAR